MGETPSPAAPLPESAPSLVLSQAVGEPRATDLIALGDSIQVVLFLQDFSITLCT